MTDETPASRALIPRQAFLAGRSTPRQDAEDEALHPTLRALMRAPERSALGRAWTGLKTPLEALRFLIKQPSLWSSVIWPTLITIGLFTLGMWAVYSYAGDLALALWAKPAGQSWISSLWLGLWWSYYALTHLVAALMTYGAVIVVGGVLASPFNDVISERTEALLLGPRRVEGPKLSLVSSTLSSLRSTAIIAGMYVSCLIPLLALHLIPGVGSVAYTLIAAALSAFFVAMEYCDVLLERKGFRMKAKFGVVWQERAVTMGFGAGMSALLAIPLLNFLCIPLAVIGGTMVGLALEQRELYGPGQDEPRRLT